MNDILYMVLRLVLVAAITVLVRYAVPLIKKEIKTNTTLENAQFLIDISNAVADAVSTTSQVFVDDLKAEGAFGDLEKNEAASRALEICLQSLTADCKAYIVEEYKDLVGFLRNKIEAEVRRQKAGYNVLSAEIDEIK